MVGNVVLNDKGVPVSSNGTSLAVSTYNPPKDVMDLFARVQKDYQTAYALQHKPFDEFDGHSLLERAKLDQETFAAFVGLEYVAKSKKWRFKGRKNTARNKLIGILAHIIAGMLFPVVFAQNDQDEEDKVTARAMRILIEEWLRGADYEVKFFYATLSALVNPAVNVEVEYVEEMTTIRERMRDGKMNVRQVVDELMSGLFAHIIPLDEIMYGDFHSGTADVQAQPFVFRLRRISHDKAKGKYAGRFYYGGQDVFDFVHAGMTHVMHGQSEGQQLFDIGVDDADANYVQELTVKYRKDDLELTWVGGVAMFNYDDPYNNPIQHRRMVLARDNSWYTIPLYNIAMSGFEPIDPAGRFLWFKSAAFKEFWEDKKITELDRLLVDGVKLDVMKPMFLSGVSSVDESVMAPGATVAMPKDATATAYSLGPNLVAAYQQIVQAEKDMGESTVDKIMGGQTEKGITATQTDEARINARIFLGVFGFMVSNLVRTIGELTMDCVIQHATIGELDALSSEPFRVKYRTFIARGKDKGKNVTNRLIFTDEWMGRAITEDRKREIEWELYNKSGGDDSDQRIWMINPYRFARTRYSLHIEADQIIMKSMGVDRQEKNLAFEKLMDPRVLPFVDPEAVVNDFVIEEYSDGDPDKYRRKGNQDEMINALMSQATPGAAPQPAGPAQ